MKDFIEIVKDVADGMAGIGGTPTAKEFNAEFACRVRYELGLPIILDHIEPIEQLYREHGEFAVKAFPTITDFRGPLRHMEKEVQEAIESGESEEFADILLLLFSAFRLRFPGQGPDQLIQMGFDKLEVAKKRKWGKVNEHGFSEHIK